MHRKNPSRSTAQFSCKSLDFLNAASWWVVDAPVPRGPGVSSGAVWLRVLLWRPAAARQLLAQHSARRVTGGWLSLLFDIAAPRRRFVEDMIGGLDAAGRFQFLQKIAG
jgi:hypothetical protein